MTDWGPEISSFVSMLEYMKKIKGATTSDLMLASYFLSNPEFWMLRYPWAKASHRFSMEQVFIWMKVYRMLEQSGSREHFLDQMGLTDEDVRKFMHPQSNKGQQPAIAAKFGKVITPP